QIAVDPYPARHCLEPPAAPVHEVPADEVAGFLVAILVDERAVTAVLGISAQARIHDGIYQEVQQTAEDEPDADGVTRSALQPDNPQSRKHPAGCGMTKS